MIPTTTLLLILGGVFLAFCLLGALSIAAFFVHTRLRAFFSILEQFVDAVGKLSKASETLSDVPKFIAGHAKAAHSMAVQVGRLVTSVAAFEKLIVSPTANNGRDALSVPKEEDADKFFRVSELLGENPEMSVEEAEVKASAEQLQRGNMPLSLE